MLEVLRTRPPLTEQELSSYFSCFLETHKETLCAFPDFQQALTRFFLTDLTPEQFLEMNRKASAFKQHVMSCMNRHWERDELKQKLAKDPLWVPATDTEEQVATKEKVVKRVVAALQQDLRTFAGVPPLQLPVAWRRVLVELSELLIKVDKPDLPNSRDPGFDKEKSNKERLEKTLLYEKAKALSTYEIVPELPGFSPPAPASLLGDGGVCFLLPMLHGEARDLKACFVPLYVMLLGQVRPSVLPPSANDILMSRQIDRLILYRRQPACMPLLRLVIQDACVRARLRPTRDEYQLAGILAVLADCVEQGDTGLFPAYPGSSKQEQWIKEVIEACAEIVRSQRYRSRKLGDGRFLDFHRPHNYGVYAIDVASLLNEFRPPRISDTARSQFTLEPAKIGSVELTAEDIRVFSSRPLDLPSVRQHLLEVRASSEGLANKLECPVPTLGLSRAENALLQQVQNDMQADFSARLTKKEYRLKYLGAEEMQALHAAVLEDEEGSAEDSTSSKTSAILSHAHAELNKLKTFLNELRSTEAMTVTKTRDALEELANAGTAQLLHFESIRLKTEFMINGLLHKDYNLQSANSRLAEGDSSRIFCSLAGLLLRSVRLSHIKGCISAVTALQGSIEALISNRLLLRVAQMTRQSKQQQNSETVPTFAAIQWALRVGEYSEEKSWEALQSVIRAQEQLAKRLAAGQGVDASVAVTAAKIIVHLEDFDVGRIEAVDTVGSGAYSAALLCDLEARACYYRGKPLRYSSFVTASAASMVHRVQHAAANLAAQLMAQRMYIDPSGRFDPRFLVFEYIVNFMLRPRQVELVQTFHTEAVGNRSTVQQMIMGAGKTTVIAPLLALLLADGDTLVQVVMPKPLIEMGHSVLQKTFSTLVPKQVVMFSFSRSDESLASFENLYAQLDRARTQRSVVITTPETVKSVMLKYIDILSRLRALSPALSLPRTCFVTRYVRDEVDKQVKKAKELQALADALGSVLALWKLKCVCLLDEVDSLFHPLRSELNFPIGQSEELHLVASGDRFELPLFLLDAVFFRTEGRACLEVPNDHLPVLESICEAMEHGISQLAFQKSPHAILLRKEFYFEHMVQPLAQHALVWLQRNPVVRADALAHAAKISDMKYGDSKNAMPEVVQRDVLAYIAERGTPAAVKEQIQKIFGPEAIMRLNLARNWLLSFLPHTLGKIHRVDYGLLQQAHLDGWSKEEQKNKHDSRQAEPQPQSVSRLLMAVPFVGKDVPSRHSEFAHPEVLIGMSIVSYRHHGLRRSDLRQLVSHLKQRMLAEPGDYYQRASRILFDDWIAQHELQSARAGKAPEKILPLELFPLQREDQVSLLMRAFARLPEVIMFYLRMCFRRVLKYKGLKLQVCVLLIQFAVSCLNINNYSLIEFECLC